mmetsp:Transcript_49915/g.144809  ORF Transcript_49915/g.144809 Transcript_49915/m.144809 type:complete len:200 (-) Transcript_49915:4057-4656(-)
MAFDFLLAATGTAAFSPGASSSASWVAVASSLPPAACSKTTLPFLMASLASRFSLLLASALAMLSISSGVNSEMPQDASSSSPNLIFMHTLPELLIELQCQSSPSEQRSTMPSAEDMTSADFSEARSAQRNSSSFASFIHWMPLPGRIVRNLLSCTFFAMPLADTSTTKSPVWSLKDVCGTVTSAVIRWLPSSGKNSVS